MKEIVAVEAFGMPYLTQKVEVSKEERGYWTRISGANIAEDNYRGASNEEREAWRLERDAHRPNTNK